MCRDEDGKDLTEPQVRERLLTMWSSSLFKKVPDDACQQICKIPGGYSGETKDGVTTLGEIPKGEKVPEGGDGNEKEPPADAASQKVSSTLRTSLVLLLRKKRLLLQQERKFILGQILKT